MARLTLSLTERIILANQLRILEAVVPDEAKDYAHMREALTSGYELDYGKLSRSFDDDVMTVDQCQEVWQILEMHRAMVFSYRDLKDKTGIDPVDVQFGGFDGNEETKQFGYYRYIRDENKYGELTPPDEGNSHCPTLGRYRRMLRAFNQIRENKTGRDKLTADEIKTVIAAGERL